MVDNLQVREIGRPVVTAWLEHRSINTLEHGDAADLMERVGAAIQAERFAHISPASTAPVVDKRIDGAYIAGAKFGWNCRDANDNERFQAAIRGRYDEIRAATTSTVAPQPPDNRPSCWHCGVVLAEAPKLRCEHCPTECDAEGCEELGCATVARVEQSDELTEARRLLTKSCYVIQQLSEQQAMPDNFYERTLKSIGLFLERDNTTNEGAR